jgi:hypothetical protein
MLLSSIGVRFTSKALDFSAGSLDEDIDFIPILVLLSYSTYTGLSLWRYDTTGIPRAQCILILPRALTLTHIQLYMPVCIRHCSILNIY